ncbi:hypothetical protein ACX5LA_000329 [Campylobacter coli]
MSGEYIISGFLTICLVIASYQAYKVYKKEIEYQKIHENALITMYKTTNKHRQ